MERKNLANYLTGLMIADNKTIAGMTFVLQFPEGCIIALFVRNLKIAALLALHDDVHPH